jgi:hypothetical protein
MFRSGAMYLSSVDSFLQGIKPSCYENRTKLDAVKLDELSVYPYYDDNEEFRLYFRDEALKQRFMTAIKGLDRNNSQYIKVFGDVLGYPPKATEFFADYQTKRQVDVTTASIYFQNVRVNMLYCGVQFMGHVEDVGENALWMWERYRHNSPMRFKLMQADDDPLQITVNYRDYDALKRRVNECMEFLNYKPIVHT